jgi:hypothetical protein
MDNIFEACDLALKSMDAAMKSKDAALNRGDRDITCEYLAKFMKRFWPPIFPNTCAAFKIQKLLLQIA